MDGDNLRFLAPALFASTCWLPPHGRTRTPHSHRTPPVGVQSQGTHNKSSHAQSRQCRQDNSGVKELQWNQADTTLSPHAAATNLTHQLASIYSNDHRPVLANQLTGTGAAIRPRQWQLVLAKSGSLVPVSPLCWLAPMATPSQGQDFPQLLPPREKFLSTETGLLFLGNPACTNILLECVLIAEIRRGDPLGLLYRIPLPQDQKTLVAAAGSLNSTATEESSQHRSTDERLRLQAPPLLERAAPCSASTAWAATHETLGECATWSGSFETVCLSTNSFQYPVRATKTSAAAYAECP